MNEYQTKIYNNLSKLADTSDSFFYKDESLNVVGLGNADYRIFNYRLCSYSDFLNESALECRGVMFEMNEHGNPQRLAAMPMHKFFNLNENPFTENINFTNTTHVMEKEDGSLISTYLHCGHLLLKSKGSLTSEQATQAMEWLYFPENELFRDELHRFACINHTVNMEWTSPNNRIVLGYEKPNLVVLNVRNNMTGGYLDNNNFTYDSYPKISKHLVKDHIKDVLDMYDFIERIPDMEHIEGYVIRLGKDMVKIKTNWYLARHRAKDSINSPKRLFKAIVGEEIDDIMSLFHDDSVAMKTIQDMTDLVIPKYNNMIVTVEEFYSMNGDLSRKDYAIKAQSLGDGYMSLYMNEYIGRKSNYKEFSQKNYEMFIGKVDD